MDLTKYKKADLFLAAIKAEVESQKMYRTLAGKTENPLLRDKLLFLVDEEEKHQKHVERLYKKETGAKKVKLPESVPVPYLAMEPSVLKLTAVRMLGIALEAEKAATEFYADFAELFPADSDEAFLLAYFSSMERGHWRLFETELEYLKKAKRPVPIPLD